MKWAPADHHGPGRVRRLLEAGWPNDVLLNVNFPDVAHGSVSGVEVAVQGRRDLSELYIDARIDARSVPYSWLGYRREIGEPQRDTDLGAVRAGAISVTPLQLDLTDLETHKSLAKALG